MLAVFKKLNYLAFPIDPIKKRLIKTFMFFQIWIRI